MTHKGKSALCANVLAAFLGISACTVGPDYTRPEANVPVAFKEAMQGWKEAEPSNELARGPWWAIYNDPQLNELAPQVEINNQNLKAYEAAYRQAQAVVRESRSNLFPTITASPSLTRARGGGTTATTQVAEVNATWDLDLWGKVRRQVESDHANAQATAAELADLTLSAQAELVADYHKLRYQDSLARLLADTVRAYEKSYKITKDQYDAGTAAQSDVITAETLLESTKASAIAARQLRAQYEHAIALLTGVVPSQLTISEGQMSSAVPDMPITLPSVLLERRPDIAESERKIKKQNALVGVAIAAYYPSVSLSGLLGSSGSAPIFSAANAVWSVAASGSATLIDGGARSATVDSAKAAYDESVANYRQVVLTAFHDVEDNLSDLRILGEQEIALQKAVYLAKRAVSIALNEYQAGLAAYTAVVTAQATELSNEETALQAHQNRLVASANLIKSLGGGWTIAKLP